MLMDYHIGYLVLFSLCVGVCCGCCLVVSVLQVEALLFCLCGMWRLNEVVRGVFDTPELTVDAEGADPLNLLPPLRNF